MRLAPALALALAVLAAAPGQAAPARAAPALSPADRAEISALFARWEKAWADGDAAAWSRLFHEDGTWVLWTGGEWRGRAQIARDFARPFATVYRDSIQRIRLVELRRLAPNVVVARIRSTTTGDSRQPGVTIHGNKLLVLTRRPGGRWLVLYGQNTRLTDAEAAKVK
ncbi:MAG TPA: SgcJ/EcaC family oxidoreductase [Sphingomicrobium sp.]|nr:SgcJ/EcaC family oxidoreductase [Sphingomicrobium sp.]